MGKNLIALALALVPWLALGDWGSEFDELMAAARAAAPAAPELVFTWRTTRPAQIVLGSSYSGPAVPALALYDAGNGWTAYTSKTIVLSSNTLKFKGDWRTASANYNGMFRSSFAEAYLLDVTGAFPAVPAAFAMFNYTFYGCSGICSIPPDLFNGCYGVPAANMFSCVFTSCLQLTGIPAGLFDCVRGAPAGSMFYQAFSGCVRMAEPLPQGLFANMSGPPAAKMFQETFKGCTALTGQLPPGLFAGISGPPATYMYDNTFYNCGKLTGQIPGDLFGSVSGAPATYMYRQTLQNCAGLTGSIPQGLFGTLAGAPALQMFVATFSGCTGLTGSIPVGLFGDLTAVEAYNMFNLTFSGCTGLTGPSALMPDGTTYLYVHFAAATSPGHAYTGATGLSDYAAIPALWK